MFSRTHALPWGRARRLRRFFDDAARQEARLALLRPGFAGWVREMMAKKSASPIDLLWLSLYAFLGVGLEVALIGAEGLLDSQGAGAMSAKQHVVHWLLTSLIWVVVALWLTRVARTRYGYDVWGTRPRPSTRQLVVGGVTAAVYLVVTSVAWQGLKPASEIASLGAVLFGFQCLYYVAEAVLITLIVALAQEAGDRQYTTRWVPWGGLVAGASWGLMHFFTQGSLLAGAYGVAIGISFGIVHLALNKDGRRSFIAIAVLFIL